YCPRRESANNLPLIKGLVDDTRLDRLRKNGSIPLDRNRKQLAKEALELVQLIARQGIEISELRIEPYRGFFMITKEDNIEISIGRSPFNSRLTQLKEILKNLKNKGSQALRIELDYKG